ncbi:hypothetical protein GCM10019017_14620 [Streptomyces showdoensis]
MGPVPGAAAAGVGASEASPAATHRASSPRRARWGDEDMAVLLRYAVRSEWGTAAGRWHGGISHGATYYR